MGSFACSITAASTPGQTQASTHSHKQEAYCTRACTPAVSWASVWCVRDLRFKYVARVCGKVVPGNKSLSCKTRNSGLASKGKMTVTDCVILESWSSACCRGVGSCEVHEVIQRQSIQEKAGGGCQSRKGRTGCDRTKFACREREARERARESFLCIAFVCSRRHLRAFLSCL